MRVALRQTLSLAWAAAVLLCGCGEAVHVLVKSHLVLITPSDALPKNLASLAELVITSP